VKKTLLSCALALALAHLAPGRASGENLPQLVQRLRPSIVLIHTGGTRVDFKRLPEREHLEPRSAGTGFVIDEAGYIVTNNHVVLPHLDWPDPALRVSLWDGRELAATLVGRDELSDLAVLKVDVTGLHPLAFASDPPPIGGGVLAIGFGLAFELEGMPSVTRGVVSALRRSARVARRSRSADRAARSRRAHAPRPSQRETPGSPRGRTRPRTERNRRGSPSRPPPHSRFSRRRPASRARRCRSR
jgi:S1-C subfamily serine protease